MIFVFLYYECGNLLHMKTFAKEQKDEALEWHRKHPEAVFLIGSQPTPKDFVLEFLTENKK